MSSNYILARSKDEEILKKAAVGGAVTGILQYLLDNNIIDGVLTLKPEDDIYDGIPTIATTSEELLKNKRFTSLCTNNDCRPHQQIFIW